MPTDDRDATEPGDLAEQAIEAFTAYERTRQLPRLEAAVTLFRVALAATAADRPDRAVYLSNLGGALRALSLANGGDAAALAEAADLVRAAVDLTPPEHPERVTYLSNLCATLQTLSEQTGDVAVLTKAVEAAREVAAAHPPGHPSHAAVLSDLGTVLRRAFYWTGDTAALAEAVDVGRQAVAATRAGDPNLAGRLSNLGNSLLGLYRETGQAAALGEAIAAGHRAVAVSPADDPHRPMFLSNLADSVLARGDKADIEEAVTAARDAASATPAGHPRQAAIEGNLAVALAAQSGLSGDASVLAEAVRAGRRAVAATPASDLERAKRLSNLGVMLQELHRRTGEAALLTEAIAVGRDAVTVTPADRPDRAEYLSNLANSLRELAAETGAAAAADEAVDVARQAATAVGDDHPDRPSLLVNLTIALRDQFERTADVTALSEAVTVARLAVRIGPADGTIRMAALAALSGVLLRIYERTGDEAVLEESVQAAREALALVPVGHPDRAGRLSNLGGVLQVLFEHARDTVVLEEAVDTGRQAVAALPADHPSRAAYLSNLGASLLALHRETGQTGALAGAERSFIEAGQHDAAPVSVRIGAYRAATALPDRPGRQPDEMLTAAEAAVALLPLAAARTLDRADREHAVSQAPGLASRAAAAAVAAGRPDRAVELLEQARGVLVADTLDARSDLARLREQAPQLATELSELHARLEFLDIDRADTDIDTASPDDPWRRARDRADVRRRAHAEWEALTEQIRTLDGFSDFLRAPGAAQLAAQAQGGPIVFVYAAPTRCDALILTTGDPPVQAIELATLTEVDARRQVNRLLAARRTMTSADAGLDDLQAAQEEMLGVLSWAWDAIAEPVLNVLGYTAMPSGEWPRLWWCPVGILTYLPLHAAGHIEDLGPRTVLDRVVSSYVVTVRALAHARERQAGQIEDTTLVVAVPDAPGAPPLSGVAAEARALTELIPGARALAPATPASVLAALPGYAVAHFACHGVADWTNPSASHLLLSGPGPSTLTVGEIAALRLSGALAYLSACDTSRTNPDLIDEAIHITGAFHLAGYQNVIGTFWPVSDLAARLVAEDMYRHITSEGTRPPDSLASAVALHHAIRRLRTRWPRIPALWAPHAHTGI